MPLIIMSFQFVSSLNGEGSIFVLFILLLLLIIIIIRLYLFIAKEKANAVQLKRITNKLARFSTIRTVGLIQLSSLSPNPNGHTLTSSIEEQWRRLIRDSRLDAFISSVLLAILTWMNEIDWFSHCSRSRSLSHSHHDFESTRKTILSNVW